MKLYKSLFLTAVAAFAFASCSDKGYWEPYEAEEAQYSFAQPKQSYSLNATDSLSSVVVTLYRDTKSGEVTLPLDVVVSDTNVIVIKDSTVTFAAGSDIAELEVVINEANIVMGTTYSAEIAFVVDSINFTEANYAISGNKSHSISIVKDYTWVSAGKVVMLSNWAGAKAEVPVENAKEYSVAGYKLYRLNSPYYYLEPSYCPKKGAHLQFILDDEANAVTISPVFQAIGEAASAGGEWFFYFHPQAPYCSFSNEGNVYTMKGAWAYTDAAGNASLYDYATELFQWVEGWPGK